MIPRLALVTLTLLLSGCASDVVQGAYSSTAYIQATELPRPDPPGLYLIRPLDRLTIDVFGLPELNNKEVQVDAGGRISFPIVGVIEVGGMSLEEAQSLVEAGLRAGYVRSPQVAVNLKEARPQTVTIDGQVRDPGLYPIESRMTLMQAIAAAKGLAEFARLEDVVVFRTSGGVKLAALFNLRAIRSGEYADPEVYANDVIVVGESPARRMFRDAVQALPALTNPLAVILQNN